MNESTPRSSKADRESRRPTPPILQLGADDAAAALGMSRDMLDDLDGRGLLPAPIRLGRRKFWPVSELQGWLEAGAPDRASWVRLRNGRK